MPNNYIYLLSSLPALFFGSKTPVTSASLLWSCRGLVAEGTLETIKFILDGGILYGRRTSNSTLARWRDFDTALRNDLVKVRLARKRQDPAKHLREGAESGIPTNHLAINAYRAANPLESERVLDAGRWRALDELAAGHYFDEDALYIYALKLSILEKWAGIEAADKAAALENTLALT